MPKYPDVVVEPVEPLHVMITNVAERLKRKGSDARDAFIVAVFDTATEDQAWRVIEKTVSVPALERSQP